MLKKVLYLFLFLLFPINLFASEVAIRAIVNGDIITSYDVEQRAKLSHELLKLNKYTMSDSEIENKVLDEMIDDKIKVAEASRFGIHITPIELDEAKKRMEKYLNLPDGGYDKLVKKLDIEPSVVNKQIEADVIWMKFMYSVLRSYVKVTDSELDLLIENMKNEKQFQYEISSIIAEKSQIKSLSEKMKNISTCDDFIKFAKQNGKAGSGLKFTLTDKQMDKKLHNLLSHTQVLKLTPFTKINDNNTAFFICDKSQFTPEFSNEEKEEIRFSILQNKLDAFSNKYFEKIKASSVIDKKY